MSRLFSIAGPTVLLYWVLYTFAMVTNLMARWRGTKAHLSVLFMHSELGLGKTKERYRDTLRIWIK